MKPTTELFLAPAFDAEVSLIATATEVRDELVLEAAKVLKVSTPAEAIHAKDLMDAIKLFTAKIEVQRKDVKEPYLSAGRKIDALAKQLADAPTEQFTRLSKLSGAYALRQRTIADDAALLARQQEAEILRKANEKAQAAIDSGRNVEAKLDKLEVKTADAIAEVKAQAPTVFVPKTTLRVVPVFEVTDIHALYKQHPELVKLEVNTAALNNYLRAVPKADLAGVRHWTEAKAS